MRRNSSRRNISWSGVVLATLVAIAAVATQGCASGSGSVGYIGSGKNARYELAPWLVEHDPLMIPVVLEVEGTSDEQQLANLVVQVTIELSNKTGIRDRAVDAAEARLIKLQPVVARALYDALVPGSRIVYESTIRSEDGKLIRNPDQRPALKQAHDAALEGATAAVADHFAEFPESKDLSFRVFIAKFHVANP